MNVFIHFHFQLFYVLDPLVLYGVWQATENIVAILHTPRNHRINPFVLRVVIHEIEHVNIRTHLAKSLNPPKALFKARRIPGKVHIDQLRSVCRLSPSQAASVATSGRIASLDRRLNVFAHP
jgi:hypothetical protein